MASLVTHSTAAAQWHALVSEAEHAAACPLVEELESYLVFLLMRFTHRPEIVGNVLALDYLNGVLATGRAQQDKLREVGDQCLLFSGLFPQQATWRQVKISYFVDLGRSAYQQLSTKLAHGYAELYAHLSQDFVTLMDVLHAIRQLGGAKSGLDPFQAYELWAESGSRQAYQMLRDLSDGLPAVLKAQDKSLH